MEQTDFETKLITLWKLREEFRCVINSKTQSKLEPSEVTVRYSGEDEMWIVTTFPSLLVVAHGNAYAFTRNGVNESLDVAIEEMIGESEKELEMIKEGKVKSV